MRFDLLVGPVLLVILLAAFGRDYRSLARRHESGDPDSQFPVMRKPANLHLGGVPIYQQVESLLTLDNFAEREPAPGGGGGTVRQALGPGVGLDILTDQPAARVRFRLRNRAEGQEITVSCNGRTLETIGPLAAGETISRELRVETRPRSVNRFRVEFSRWNHHDGAEIDANDPRPVAATFEDLGIFLLSK